MSALDLMLLRPRPIELRTSRSVKDTLADLRAAFPPQDLWALSLKPFAPPTNVGTFEGETVRLRIIDMQGRNWLHPELYAHIRAVEDGSVLIGSIRYDVGLKALYVMLLGLSALAAAMVWSTSSSLGTTVLLTPAIVFAFQSLVGVLQASEIATLLSEATKAINTR